MKSDRVVLQCDCKCCEIAFEKFKWADGDVTYDISVLDSRYDHEANGVLNRIKNAFKVLFGKQICYNDVSLDGDERFDELLEGLRRLREA